MKLNINFDYFCLFNNFSNLFGSISAPLIEPLKNRFQDFFHHLKRELEIPAEQLNFNDYEDLYFERIKNLCTRPLDLIDRSKRFTNGPSEAYSYDLTGCAMSFYAVLFVFEDAFIDPRQNANSITDALRPNKNIEELLASLEDGYQKLKYSSWQEGILYPVTLDNFTGTVTPLNKQFPGHCLIIQQLPPSKSNPDVSYRIYQSYLFHYTLKQFMQNHSKFLNLNHTEILNFCKNIGRMLAKTVWDGELDCLYKTNFLVDHHELQGIPLTRIDHYTQQKTSLMTLQFTKIEYYTSLDIRNPTHYYSNWSRPISSEGSYYWSYRSMFPTYV